MTPTSLTEKSLIYPVVKLVLTEVFPGANLLIDGEIPRGIYLRIGQSGAGKTVFCKSFIARGHQTRWIIFNITERGISMVEEDTPRCA